MNFFLWHKFVVIVVHVAVMGLFADICLGILCSNFQNFEGYQRGGEGGREEHTLT